MRKLVQRLSTYIISLMVLVTVLSIGAFAYSYPSMPSDVSNLKVTVGSVSLPLTNYPDGSYFDPEKCTMTVSEQQLFGITAGSDINLRGWECVGFARYVYTALFYKYPQNATIDNYLAYASGSNSYGYTDVIKSVYGCTSISGGYTAATLKTLFTACQPGAVMRVGGHSMVLMAIYDNGFVIYDANFSSSNEVDVRSYTWQSFIDSMGGREIIALHMPKYYPGYSYSTGQNGSGSGTGYTVDASTAGTYVVVNCSSLNVRSGPSTSASRIGSLSSGAVVTVSGSYGDWAKITFNGSEAWVSMDYLDASREIQVSFDANGGNASASSGTYMSGQKFGSLPTASKANRNFIGWKYNGNYYTAVSTVPDVDHLPLKAVWGIAGFKDVTESEWYAAYVEKAWLNGLINSSENFYPGNNTKRADFITVLSREYTRETGIVVSGTCSNVFTDVPVGAYYDAPVAWAYSAGIASGTSSTTFSPDGYLTREQMATFLYRYAKYVGVLNGDYAGASVIYNYADGASVSNYAVNPMNWAVNIGLLQGDTDGNLNPGSYAKRSEMITIMVRFMQYMGG